MRRALTLAAIIFGLLAVPAQAAKLPVPPTAVVLNQGCAGPLKVGNVVFQPTGACTIGDTIYLPRAWATSYGAFQYRLALWHEYGHVFDHNYLTAAERARLARFFGETGEWANGANEVFADTYANCAIGETYDDFQSNYGNSPRSKRTYNKSCRVIRRVAVLNNLMRDRDA